MSKIPAPSKTANTEAPLVELSVDRNELLAEVQAAARVTEGKTTVPIMTHLLLDARAQGILAITGSNLQRTLNTECAAQVRIAGSAAVPAQKLLNYLKLLPSGRVNLKVLTNHQMQINSGHSRTRMPGLAPESYPAGAPPPPESIRISVRALRTLIRQSLFAVATSEEKYLLNTGLLLLRTGRMGMVATDGRRLSMVEVEEDGPVYDTLRKVLLPRECMGDLMALFSWSKEETVSFGEDETNLFFHLGPRRLSVRKLTGVFPNYEHILPRENQNCAVVPARDLYTSVQRALEFADERSSAVKLHLADNVLTVSASVADRGESQESLPLSYNASPVTIGFNGSYLVDFIKTVGTEGDLKLALKDGKTAAVISPETFNPEFQQRYVVMPLRV